MISKLTTLIKKNKVFIFFIFSLMGSYLIGLLYYDSTQGLDWHHYIDYYEYFLGIDNQFIKGDRYAAHQSGPLYFFIISAFIKLQFSILGPHNTDIVLNNAVQLANFLLYVFGLLGIFYLLDKEGYKKKTILIAFSVVNFLPAAFYFRLTMKPEVLAFALFPWCIYSLRIYFEKRTVNSLIFSAVILSTLVVAKASILAMVSISLVIIYWKELIEIKKNLLFYLLTLFLFIALLYENQLVTGMWVFEKLTPLKWQNTANIEFFFNFNIKELILNPYRHKHSGSLISIILLDTVGDYFTFFWNHREIGNYIAFNKISYTNNFWINSYLREYVSIIIASGFYLLIFYFYAIKEKNRKYLLFPFAGIISLSLSAIGIPSKNFDPVTADTFKVHYYSFLITISFIFLLVNLINKNRKTIYPILLLIPIFLFCMGFPKISDANTNKEILLKFNHSEICKVFTFATEESPCRNKHIFICELNPYGSTPGTLEREVLTGNFTPIELQSRDKIITVNSTSECLDYLAEGYEYEHSLKRSYFVPSEIYLNKILMLTTLIYCFYFSLYQRKIKL